MKRIVALLLACAFVMGALAAPAMAAKTVVIKIAGMKPEGEPETIGIENRRHPEAALRPHGIGRPSEMHTLDTRMAEKS